MNLFKYYSVETNKYEHYCKPIVNIFILLNTVNKIKMLIIFRNSYIIIA